MGSLRLAPISIAAVSHPLKLVHNQHENYLPSCFNPTVTLRYLSLLDIFSQCQSLPSSKKQRLNAPPEDVPGFLHDDPVELSTILTSGLSSDHTQSR